jgi:hypothetical protein
MLLIFNSILGSEVQNLTGHFSCTLFFNRFPKNEKTGLTEKNQLSIRLFVKMLSSGKIPNEKSVEH